MTVTHTEQNIRILHVTHTICIPWGEVMKCAEKQQVSQKAK